MTSGMISYVNPILCSAKLKHPWDATSAAMIRDKYHETPLGSYPVFVEIMVYEVLEDIYVVSAHETPLGTNVYFLSNSESSRIIQN